MFAVTNNLHALGRRLPNSFPETQKKNAKNKPKPNENTAMEMNLDKVRRTVSPAKISLLFPGRGGWNADKRVTRDLWGLVFGLSVHWSVVERENDIHFAFDTGTSAPSSICSTVVKRSLKQFLPGHIYFLNYFSENPQDPQIPNPAGRNCLRFPPRSTQCLEQRVTFLFFYSFLFSSSHPTPREPPKRRYAQNSRAASIFARFFLGETGISFSFANVPFCNLIRWEKSLLRSILRRRTVRD